MNSWLKPVKTASALNNGFVLLTIISTKGSTPCSNGDKIVFSGSESVFGSIGGGNLEFKALSFAGELLSLNSNGTYLKKYPLGASLGQCCGGYVNVMFESFIQSDATNSWIETVSNLLQDNEDFIVATIVDSNSEIEFSCKKFVYLDGNLSPNIDDKKISSLITKSARDLLLLSDSPTIVQFENQSGALTEVCFEKVLTSEVQPVVVFGAGHISRALMPILINLPIKIYWVDDRAEQFDKYQGDTSQIDIICDDFVQSIPDLPDSSYCLVITYSHQIDFEICEKMITQNNFSYLGMIGSEIKGKKFRDRFHQKNFSEEVINKFICPIGDKQKFLKSPAAIAVTIAMDLINFIEHKRQPESV
ncbi:XdhC family protein [Candidatus Pseudothioglobus sp. Uisw_086]|uniref:XdhC family protein n=1 Tax=Candidatus Pseudothioglobus sp. Uisw_086 TaxID=3230998 RepID=UPI003A8C8593